MTQFPPPYDAPDSPSVHAPWEGQPKWSVAAILGFVFSLIGCVGITVPLALGMAVFGIVQCREGRRRGMGLAIAAIPVSLVTGAISVLLLAGGLIGYSAAGATQALSIALSTPSEQSLETVKSLHTHCSTEFQQAVSLEALHRWVLKVQKRDGTLTAPLHPSGTQGPSFAGKDKISMTFEGKFVNGSFTVTFTFTRKSGLTLLIDDMEVNGLSPRDLGD